MTVAPWAFQYPLPSQRWSCPPVSITYLTGLLVTSRTLAWIAAAPFHDPPGSIRTAPSLVSTRPKVALLARFSLSRCALSPTSAQTPFVTGRISKAWAADCTPRMKTKARTAE